MELSGGFEPPTTPAAFHRGLCPLLAASRHAFGLIGHMAFLACHPRNGNPMPNILTVISTRGRFSSQTPSVSGSSPHSRHKKSISTNCLWIWIFWSSRADSNRRPARYECAALPTELRKHSGHLKILPLLISVVNGRNEQKVAVSQSFQDMEGRQVLLCLPEKLVIPEQTGFIMFRFLRV